MASNCSILKILRNGCIMFTTLFLIYLNHAFTTDFMSPVTCRIGLFKVFEKNEHNIKISACTSIYKVSGSARLKLDDVAHASCLLHRLVCILYSMSDGRISDRAAQQVV